MALPAKRIDRQTVVRALIIMAAFLAVALVLIFALFRLQILEYDYYQKEVIDQLTHETEVNPERGIIYDRNGNILATNTTVYLIFKRSLTRRGLMQPRVLAVAAMET